MSGQGYHFALDRRQAQQVLSCPGPLEVLDLVNDIFDTCSWDDPMRATGRYKDWNVLLACLTEGSYDPRGGTPPLNQCFFGGRLLVRSGSIVNLVVIEDVREVAVALANLDKNEFRRRYLALPHKDRWDSQSETDEYFETLYLKFIELRDFYQCAAQEGRAVLFYTDDPLDYFFP